MATFNGTSAADVFVGTLMADTFNNISNNDTFSGGGGNDTANLSAGQTSNADVDLGEDDDRFATFNNSFLRSGNTIDGGEGTDTFDTNGNDLTIGDNNQIINFEILEGRSIIIDDDATVDFSDFVTNNLTVGFTLGGTGSTETLTTTQDDDVVSNISNGDIVNTLGGNDTANLRSSGTTSNAEVDLGEGDDTFRTFSNSVLGSGNVIDGGEGTDTFDTNGNDLSIGDNNQIINFEILEGRSIIIEDDATVDFSDFVTNNLTEGFTLGGTGSTETLTTTQDDDVVSNISNGDIVNTLGGNDTANLRSSGTTSNAEVDLGEGDDTFRTFSNSVLGSGNVIDGGEGTDTFDTNGNDLSIVDNNQIINFEILEGGRIIIENDATVDFSGFVTNNLTGAFELRGSLSDRQTLTTTQDDDRVDSVNEGDIVNTLDGNDTVTLSLDSVINNDNNNGGNMATDIRADDMIVDLGAGDDVFQIIGPDSNGSTSPAFGSGNLLDGGLGTDTFRIDPGNFSIDDCNVFANFEILEGNRISIADGAIMNFSDFETNNLTEGFIVGDSDAEGPINLVTTNDDDTVQEVSSENEVNTLDGDDTVTLALNETTDDAKISLGAGNDTFIPFNANSVLGSDNVIDGGAGTDTFGSAGVDFRIGDNNTITNFEILEGRNIIIQNGGSADFSDFVTNNLTGQFQLEEGGGTFIGTQDADDIRGSDSASGDSIFIGENDTADGGSGSDTLYYDGTVHDVVDDGTGTGSGSLIRLSDGAVIGSYSNFENFNNTGTTNIRLATANPTAFVDVGTVSPGRSVTIDPRDNDLDVAGGGIDGYRNYRGPNERNRGY